MNEKEMIITDAMTLKHVEHSLMEGSGWKTAPRSCPEGRGACWERRVRVVTVTPEGLSCGSRNRRLNSTVSKDTRRCRFQLRGGENKTNNRNLSPESHEFPRASAGVPDAPARAWAERSHWGMLLRKSFIKGWSRCKAKQFGWGCGALIRKFRWL